MKLILKILDWIYEKDRQAHIEQAKRIDDRDDRWCNSAYERLYRNF